MSLGGRRDNMKNSVTYNDVLVEFSQEEWALLEPSQKQLYKNVMLETYNNLTAIGYNWEDHDIEEHFQSSTSNRSHGYLRLTWWTNLTSKSHLCACFCLHECLD
ncbi:zinc finger protein 431-like [Meriones unguiculatus]|uniref:zinc finger protein 431-like n=1 Tax=Meriones unguiculatus TaxID=10047 RepID=UPI00293F5B56|nr:zinc finger protein 431-like [Meriones unguiculatus]